MSNQIGHNQYKYSDFDGKFKSNMLVCCLVCFLWFHMTRLADKLVKKCLFMVGVSMARLLLLAYFFLLFNR